MTDIIMGYPLATDDVPSGINAGTDLGPPSGPYTTFDLDAWLDLDDSVGQRSASFLFALEDGVTGDHKAQIHPLRDNPATLSSDTGRTIPRALRLALGVDDTALVDVVRDRVLPYMLIRGVLYPLGRYMFTDQSVRTSTGGALGDVQLVDEMLIVDQETETGFAPREGASVTATILDLLVSFAVAQPIVTLLEPSPYSTTGSWSAGTHRGQILEALAKQGDYLRPWMDHRGRFRMRRTFNPASAVASFDLDTHHRVFRDSILSSNDLLSAPNRFIITSNRGDNTPISASADIPVTAPHSVPNRGFAIVKSDDMQLDTAAQASAIAQGLAVTASVFQKVSLSTPPDPRHDAYDVVLWQGAKWLETGWAMDLTEGGEMTHDLVKAYT